MEQKFDIAKYDAYFHDGYLVQISHENDSVILELISAEMDPDDFEERLPFSKDNTLRGKLHMESVSKVLAKDKDYQGKLEMEYDYAEIYDLEVTSSKVRLFLFWQNLGPSIGKDPPPAEYIIEGERIYWEPILELPYPHNYNKSKS
ncbi:MAG: hypothetical protein SP4CHLAM5_11450 [Chlamydiia bacterium]|nr:hypothetical protein [Chlamydiia bacterium]MCH9619001.1 hypothetical protein [Chlamydiia bacterium]